MQKADENGVSAWCLRSRTGYCFIREARGRRQFSEKSLCLAYIVRNLHQIYDTPIYQAWQTFRQNFQRNICILQFQKEHAGNNAMDPAI